jgi:hypothetical protein
LDFCVARTIKVLFLSGIWYDQLFVLWDFKLHHSS